MRDLELLLSWCRHWGLEHCISLKIYNGTEQLARWQRPCKRKGGKATNLQALLNHLFLNTIFRSDSAASGATTSNTQTNQGLRLIHTSDRLFLSLGKSITMSRPTVIAKPLTSITKCHDLRRSRHACPLARPQRLRPWRQMCKRQQTRLPCVPRT